jgi:hypothetical protein
MRLVTVWNWGVGRKEQRQRGLVGRLPVQVPERARQRETWGGPERPRAP